MKAFVYILGENSYQENKQNATRDLVIHTDLDAESDFG